MIELLLPFQRYSLETLPYVSSWLRASSVWFVFYRWLYNKWHHRSSYNHNDDSERLRQFVVAIS